MIRPDLFNRMNIAGQVNQELDKSSQYYVFLNVDILNGCDFSCSGCYVNKGINSSDLEGDLKVLADVVEEINNSDYHMEEIALGPTDFFSSKNSLEILENKNFKRLFTNPETKFVLTTTLKVSVDEMRKKLDLLQKNIGHLDIDLLIATSFDEFLNDPGYLNKMKEKWKVLQESSLEFDPAFQINIHPEELIKSDPSNLSRLAKRIREEFDTILEFNPSLLRIKHKAQHENLALWMQTIKENFLNNREDFTYTMLNKSHGGMNNLVLNYKKKEFYICPFIYENVFAYEEAYKIPRKGEQYTLEDLTGSKESFVINQMQFSEKTNHCKDCEYLVSCSYKNVLTFMEANNIKSCFLGLGNGEIHGRPA